MVWRVRDVVSAGLCVVLCNDTHLSAMSLPRSSRSFLAFSPWD